MSEAPRPQNLNRIASLDAMRFFAALSLVWIHTVESPLFIRYSVLGRFGLSYFIIVSMWLLGQSVRKQPHRGWGEFAWKRTRVLYGSFLLWNAVYLVARFTKHGVFQGGSEIILDRYLLVAGTSLQLWFLPVILAAGLLAYPLVRSTAHRPAAMAACSVLLLIAAVPLSFVPLPQTGHVSATHLYSAIILSSPAICVSLAMAVGYPLMADTFKRRRSMIAGAAVFFTALGFMFFNGYHPAMQALAGLGAFVFCLPIPSRWVPSVLAHLGKWSFGIYLIHSLWSEALQAILTRADIPVSPLRDLSIYAATLAASIVSSYLLRNTRLVPR